MAATERIYRLGLAGLNETQTNDLMAALALHGGWTVLRQARGELGEDSAKEDHHGHVH